MYKLTRQNGKDFYSNTINYADNIGNIIRVKDFDDKNVGICGKGLHASRNPNDCFIGAEIPCRAFKVEGIQRIAGNNKKVRYKALEIVEEIHDLNKLFGWNYKEAVNPINPFEIPSVAITDKHIALAKKWNSVGDSVWNSVSDSVGDSVWNSVWAYIGSFFKIKQ